MSSCGTMGYKRLLVLIGVGMLGAVSVLHAQTQTLAEQRQLYQQARDAQIADDWSKARQLTEQLKNYPLYSYLRYYDLLEHLDDANYQQVVQFRKQHAQLPITDKIERRYLFKLAHNQQWHKFLQFFPQEPSTTALRCSYFYAKYRVGQPKIAYQGARRLWLSGHSQPKACDPLFAVFEKAGHLTQSLIWQRYLLAYRARQGRVQHYLYAKLTGKYQQAAIQLKNDIAHSDELLKKSPQLTKLHRQSLRLMLMHLTWKNPAQAVAIYQHYQDHLRVGSRLDRALVTQLIRSVIRYPSDSLLPWADQMLKKTKDPVTIERRIRLALSYQNWAQVQQWLHVLPKSDYQRSQWQYWQARVYSQTHQLSRAQLIFKRLASQRSYYGFLSAQRLGKPYHFSQYPRIKPMTKQALQHPRWLQVRELMTNQEYIQAYRLWGVLLEEHPKQQLRWGKLAMNYQWPTLAVYSTIEARAWGQLNLRFPFAYHQQFKAQAKRYDLDPLLSLSVARQESAFYRYAHSYAGARGVMQITTHTAKHLLSLQNKRLKSVRDLYQIDTNIELGSMYLARLLKRYDGNRYLAIAAYNAGPSRIHQWFKRFGALPADIWIEVIPFNQTRHYVKNVLSYELIYAHKSGQKRDLLRDSESAVKPTLLLAKDTNE